MSSTLPVTPPPKPGPRTPPAVRLLYLSLLVVGAIAALVVVYFFLVGLADGSVSGTNATLWFGLLATVAMILGGALQLARRGRHALASLLLALLAMPALLYGGFVLLILLLAPDWR